MSLLFGWYVCFLRGGRVTLVIFSQLKGGLLDVRLVNGEDVE